MFWKRRGQGSHPAQKQSGMMLLSWAPDVCLSASPGPTFRPQPFIPQPRGEASHWRTEPPEAGAEWLCCQFNSFPFLCAQGEPWKLEGPNSRRQKAAQEEFLLPRMHFTGIGTSGLGCLMQGHRIQATPLRLPPPHGRPAAQCLQGLGGTT